AQPAAPPADSPAGPAAAPAAGSAAAPPGAPPAAAAVQAGAAHGAGAAQAGPGTQVAPGAQASQGAGGARDARRTRTARTARGTHASGPPLSAAEVKAAQSRLVELGYWAGAASGPWDATWRHALIAFQKVEWRKPTGVLTRAEWDAMLRTNPPAPRETGPAHIEVDLARQVLFMVDDAGVVSHILPISTGSGRPFRAPGWQGVAETPCGHFTVFSRGWGWHKSQLGEMYNPLYIVGGIAIHGSLDVPPKPVSHGCIRIPMYAARRLPKLVPREMPVVVYGCKDEAPPAAVPAKR
ncbi:MAG TPA: L,D-transpeptidase family protein, partial [Thermoanaerobaculia bacterium]|nr:L,D-transpeptidase family protein [Thermoanaerobaculia bacterium]